MLAAQLPTTTTTTTTTMSARDDSSAADRRVHTLASHLKCGSADASTSEYPALLPNHRPGDENVDPIETSPFVKGAFEPRADELTTALDLGAIAIEGAVPSALRGKFLRIGPNPHFDYRGKPYHVFDGDGMIHSVTLDGKSQTGQCVARLGCGFQCVFAGFLLSCCPLPKLPGG